MTSAFQPSGFQNNALQEGAIPATGGPGAQSLTQTARFDNSNTFYTHVLTPGAVALTQSSIYTNSQTFYTHVLSKTIALTQSSRFDNSNTFYTHSLATTISLVQSARFNNSPTFYTHVLTPGAVALTQVSRFDNAPTFYTHVLTVGAVDLVQSSRFDNSPTFYTHVLTQEGGAQALTQDVRFDNVNEFYQHVISQTSPESGVVPSGGVPAEERKTYPKFHPWIHLPEEQKKPDYGIIKPEIAEIAVKAVSKAIEKRTVKDESLDIAIAEKQMREMLKEDNKRWLKAYIQVLMVEYHRQEQENEDAQIAMLLFEL
jgi:hypothetical protein